MSDVGLQRDGRPQGDPPAAQPAAPGPLRILAVEDSPSDYEYLLAVLGGSGRPVVSRRVEDEPSMAAALAEADWDAVISDNKLPRFSATGALETLRRSGKDLPFIIVSGTIGEEVAVQAMQAGADDYVMKSNMLRLMPAVERSIQAAESRRRRRAADGRFGRRAWRHAGGVLHVHRCRGSRQPGAGGGLRGAARRNDPLGRTPQVASRQRAAVGGTLRHAAPIHGGKGDADLGRCDHRRHCAQARRAETDRVAGDAAR